MAWRDDFIDALAAQQVLLVWRVEAWKVVDEPTAGAWQAVSSSAAMTAASADLLFEPPRITGSTLTPQTWACSVGAASFLVAAPSTVAQTLPRGSFVKVYCGVYGSPATGMELVWAGMVDGVSYSSETGLWQVDCLDLFAALESRLTTTALALDLFYTATGSTTIKHAHDYHIGDSTLEVVSASGFSKETGKDGCLKVTPDSGDPFYLRWTSVLGDVFTVDTTAIHGTSAADASPGQAVEEVVMLEGHPVDLVLRVLQSVTGDGSNGGYDTLPTGWGLGVPQSLIDREDAGIARSQVAAALDWQVLTQGEQDGVAWVQSLLAPAGLFLAVRQGRLTVRAVEDVREASRYPRWTLDFGEVVRGTPWELHAASPDVTKEWSNLQVQGMVSSASLVGGVYVDTLPAGDVLEYDLSDVLTVSGVTQLDETRDRLELGATQIPHKLTCTLPLRWAAATVGDRVTLEGWHEVQGRYGDLSDLRGIVTAVSPDWGAGVVDVEVHLYRLE